MEKTISLDSMPDVNFNTSIKIINRLKSLVQERIDIDFNYNEDSSDSSELKSIDLMVFSNDYNPSVCFMKHNQQNEVRYILTFAYGEALTDDNSFNSAIKDFDEFIVNCIAYGKHTLATSLIIKP